MSVAKNPPTQMETIVGFLADNQIKVLAKKQELEDDQEYYAIGMWILSDSSNLMNCLEGVTVALKTRSVGMVQIMTKNRDNGTVEYEFSGTGPKPDNAKHFEA